MTEIQHKERERNGVELDEGEIIQLIDQLPPGSNVTFTGGEVFLKKGIEKVITQAGTRHHVTLATNGLLLSGHAAMVIKAGVKAVGVSLDGPPEVHNQIRNFSKAFDRLADGVEAVLRNRHNSHPCISANAVILRDNYSRLPEVPKILKEIGINSCSFQILDLSLSRSGVAPVQSIDFGANPLKHMHPINPAALKESLLKLLQEGKKHQVDIKFVPLLSVDEIVSYYQGGFELNLWTCSLPWETMRISPYGDVYPCMNLFIGNVREHKFSELWNCEIYRKFRRALKRESLFPSCVGCCKMQRKKNA